MWQTWTALASVMVTLALGTATIVRGVRSDNALNVATNIQSTYTATMNLVEALQREVGRVTQSLVNCEKEHHIKDRQIDELQDQVQELSGMVRTLELNIEGLQRENGKHD